MAGTRIKVVADIAGEGTTNSGTWPTATAQAWIDAFEAMMLAAGFVRTADTGQLATVVAFPGNTNNVGYRVYSLNDEYSATSPLYVKVQFAWRVRGATSSSAYRFRVSSVDIGLAADGAGNLTGTTALVFTFDAIAMATSLSSSYVGTPKTVAWRKDYTTLVCMQPSSVIYTAIDAGGAYTSATSEVFFAVSRLRDYQGNVDLSGFAYWGCYQAYYGATQYFTHSVNAPFCGRLTAAADTAYNSFGFSLLGPAASYRLAPDNSPYLQPFLWGRSADSEAQYSIAGVYAFLDQSLLTKMTNISATGPEGDMPMLVMGAAVHAFDPSACERKIRRISQQNGAIYVSDQAYNTNMGIALDWSD